jgi:hypothetical protein
MQAGEQTDGQTRSSWYAFIYIYRARMHNKMHFELKRSHLCVADSDKSEDVRSNGTVHGIMKAVWKVRGLTLLLRVATLWRCGDGLFFEVPPFASDEHLATLHPLLENVLQTVGHFQISCFGAPFSWLERPRNRMDPLSDETWLK